MKHVGKQKAESMVIVYNNWTYTFRLKNGARIDIVAVHKIVGSEDDNRRDDFVELESIQYDHVLGRNDITHKDVTDMIVDILKDTKKNFAYVYCNKDLSSKLKYLFRIDIDSSFII